MSLLLDALKEAEARKRTAPAPAAQPDLEAAFATDGALALAEDVAPDVASHARAPLPPSAGVAAPAMAGTPAEALLRARAERTTPEASPVPDRGATAGGARRNRLAWLIGAAGLLILLLGAAALYQAFDAAPAPVAPPPEAVPLAVEPAARELVLEPEAPPAPVPGAARAARAATPSQPSRRAAAARASGPATPTARGSLSIQREASPLNAAWAAMQAGDLERARELYQRVQAAEPGQVDAELGLAVIAQARGDDRAALRGYRRVLESVPDHPRAWAGLAELAGEGEIEQMESRLRGLLATRPSAALHFALGNVLARQQRWADAQVEFFSATSLAPDAADYAFNLAIALDRIGKGAAAAPYYARALELAARGRAARFDPAAAQERLEQLQASQP